MRAARLLHILLLLQNRGRLSASALAKELEVTPRTVLRDVDAMTEAGLPILTHRGVQGGIELGFNYRTRLTGLAADEAEALALWLAAVPANLLSLNLAQPALRARAKLIESLPDRSRAIMQDALRRFPVSDAPSAKIDPRIPAIAQAIRDEATLTLQSRSGQPVRLRPLQMGLGLVEWWVLGPPLTVPVPQSDWGDINISRAPVDLDAKPT